LILIIINYYHYEYEPEVRDSLKLSLIIGTQFSSVLTVLTLAFRVYLSNYH